MTKKIILTTPKETLNFGKTIAQQCQKGTLIILNGTLGSGKTLFTRGIGQFLEIKEEVNSPTYVIAKEYHSGKIPLLHWDFYRIGDFDELYMSDFFELLEARNSIFVIEWANMFKNAWEKFYPRFEIDFEINSKKERLVSYSYKN
jgi:tRNA threonylcarbamoyladenosine biosynthesis protein TsaE